MPDDSVTVNVDPPSETQPLLAELNDAGGEDDPFASRNAKDWGVFQPPIIWPLKFLLGV